MAKALDIKTMVGALVGIVVGVALVPVINSTITTANISDPTQLAILNLIPFLFIVGILVAVVTGLL